MPQHRKTVVVTGASAGVGRATATEFAAHGWRVALIARGREGLEGARRDVEAAGGKALVLPLDVADADAVQAAADEVADRWGGIDAWVNDAMVTVLSPVREMTAAEYRRVTDVTYLGCVHGTLAALRHMLPRDEGAIIQVGSALAYRSIPWQSAYCAAKFAIRGFTDSLRSELDHEGRHVTVSMIQCPGMNTPQFDWSRSRLPHRAQPVPPIYQPEVAARAVYRAWRRRPRELWVGQSTLKTIVGSMAVPGYLDHLLADAATSGQMTDEDRPPNRGDNLYAPVDGDFGAHGRFDARATDNAITIDPGQARAGLFAAAGAALGLGAAMALRSR